MEIIENVLNQDSGEGASLLATSGGDPTSEDAPLLATSNGDPGDLTSKDPNRQNGTRQSPPEVNGWVLTGIQVLNSMLGTAPLCLL